MKVWILLSVTAIAFGHIELGSMGGFLTFNEVHDRINNLTTTYPNLINFPTTGNQLGQFKLSNNSANLTNPRPTAFIVSGLSGGFPMGTYQVLQLAESMASQYASGNTTIQEIVNSYDIYFIPILNNAAYIYTESQYTNDTFLSVFTDLSLNNTACTGYDIGINPDHNFGSYFNNTLSDYTNDCSSNYSSNSPYSSNITKSLSNFLNNYNSKLSMIVNYDGYGNYYAQPYAFTNNSMQGNWMLYYGNLSFYIPNGYNYGSYR